MNVNLIPHSSATNSYDLLEDVIKAIDEEPNRFDWAEWACDVERDGACGAYDVTQPACGTQACVSGWIGLLTDARPTLHCHQTERWFPQETHSDLEDLFYAEDDFGADQLAPNPGESQRDYANRGIAAIRLFMQRHKRVLKAHAISIPPRVK